jgi:hypothetical protein
MMHNQCALGRHIRNEISHSLKQTGVSRFPRTFPNRQHHRVTLWLRSTDVGCALDVALDIAGRHLDDQRIARWRPGDLGDVVDRARSCGGWAWFTSGQIRDAMGHKALGAKIREDIEWDLRHRSLAWFPLGPFPDVQDQPVVLVHLDSPAGEWFAYALEMLRRYRAGLAA